MISLALSYVKLAQRMARNVQMRGVMQTYIIDTHPYNPNSREDNGGLRLILDMITRKQVLVYN